MMKWMTIGVVLVLGIMFFINSSQEGYQKITPEQAKEKLENDEEILLLDVRTKEEYEQGYIPKSKLLPLDQLKEGIESVAPDKDKEIIVYCRSGNRSKTAANILLDMGYENVYDLGGIIDWPYEVE